MDLRLALMSGTDIPVPECQATIHQPTIKEISYIGSEDYFIGMQTLCLYKTMFIEDKDVLEKTNNFQIFMTVMNDKECTDKKADVIQILTLLFPQGKVLFTPRSLIIQQPQGNITIDANNFEPLQEALRLIFCNTNGPMDQQAFNPADDKAREIAQKLMRGRQRVAAQKGEASSCIFTQYISILAIGLKMPPQELLNCTMYQLYDLMERYSLYNNWELDVRVRLAGGKPDSQPDNWMKNIH